MESILDFMRSVPGSPRGLLDFVTGLLLAHGYLVILLGAALDNFGLPASGDVVLLAGGFFANGERAALPLVMLSGFLGATVSDHAVYWIGRRGGRPLIHRILKTRVLALLLDAMSLGRVELYFDEHGGMTLFLRRFGPGLRSMTPLFAGVSRMKYRRFLPYNLAAVLVWSTAYGAVGYAFGEYWDELLALARSAGYGLVALVSLSVAFYAYRRRRARGPARENWEKPEKE